MVILSEPDHLENGTQLLDNVAVGEHHALRHPGGATGVDDGEDVVGGEAARPLRKLREIITGGDGGQLGEGDEPPGLALHQNRGPQRRAPVTHLDHLRRLLQCRADHRDRVAVAEDLRHRVGGRARVDRHHHRRRQLAAAVAVEPLQAILGEQRDPITGGHPGMDQGRAQRHAGIAELLPARLWPPPLGILAGDARTVAVALGPAEEHADIGVAVDPVGGQPPWRRWAEQRGTATRHCHLRRARGQPRSSSVRLAALGEWRRAWHLHCKRATTVRGRFAASISAGQQDLRARSPRQPRQETVDGIEQGADNTG